MIIPRIAILRMPDLWSIAASWVPHFLRTYPHDVFRADDYHQNFCRYYHHYFVVTIIISKWSLFDYPSFLLTTADRGGTALNAIIEEGFTISALMTVHFTPDIAHELMDVYSSIYPSYSLMLEQLCVAPLLAVMVTGSRGAVHFIAFSL